MLFGNPVEARALIASLKCTPTNALVLILVHLSRRLQTEIRQCPPEAKKLCNGYKRMLALAKLYTQITGFPYRRRLLVELKKIPGYSTAMQRRAEDSRRLRRVRDQIARQVRDVRELEDERLAAEGMRSKRGKAKGGTTRGKQKQKEGAQTELEVKEAIIALREKHIRPTAKQVAKIVGHISPDHARKVMKRLQGS